MFFYRLDVNNVEFDDDIVVFNCLINLIVARKISSCNDNALNTAAFMISRAILSQNQAYAVCNNLPQT